MQSITWPMGLLPLWAMLAMGPGCGTGEAELDLDLRSAGELRLEEVVAYAARVPDNGFRRLNDAPVDSVAVSGQRFNLWISSEAEADYGAIFGASDEPARSLRSGTVLVRELLDEQGRSGLTFIGQGEPGYFPEVGDLWFAVTGPDGSLRVEDGVAQVGRLERCAACHRTRSHTAFLFGLP